MCAQSLYKDAISKGDINAPSRWANLLSAGVIEVEMDPMRPKFVYEHATLNDNYIVYNSLVILLSAGALGLNRDSVRAKSFLEHAISKGFLNCKRCLEVLLSIWVGSIKM